MHNQLLSLLGLCRAARLCSFGHDAAKAALREHPLRGKRAKLCLLCADASPRLREEFKWLAENAGVPLYEIHYTSIDIKQATQFKAVVITIDDKGFANKFASLLTPES